VKVNLRTNLTNADVLIVASEKDAASMTIRKQLLARNGFSPSEERFHGNPIYQMTVDRRIAKLVTIQEESIYNQTLTDHFAPQLVIYISRHSSKTGTPTLSVHTPGNPAQALKGGLSRRVSVAPAMAMKRALMQLAREDDLQRQGFQVSYECTHHGPSLDVPTMFIELGSTPAQWTREDAGAAVARATWAAVSERPNADRIVVGIGGPHYNQRFTRLALEEDLAFGHMIPKTLVPAIDASVIRQCVERTLEEVKIIILDWKGIRGADKPGLVEALKAIDVPTQKA
jgi:D-aminoacyl-tRNA deacylase